MLICKVCSGGEFEKVDGFFTCRQCGTVSEDIRDELQDFMTFSQPSHHSAINIIRLPRSSRDGDSSDPENRVVLKSWNIYEAFTIILRRMTDDCIKCGASPEIEPVVFTLWAQYLQKLNVAFGGNSTVGLTSDESDLEGSQKDRDLIFCHRQSQLSLKRGKKRRRSVQSSGAESDTSVEGDSRRVKKKLIKSFVQREMSVDDLTADLYEFEDNDRSVRPPWKRARSRMASFLNASEGNMSIITEGSPPEPDLARKLIYEPEYLSMNKMLSFVYLALRLTRDKLAVYDIIRWASEGHVLYSEAWAHLSQEMSLSGADMVIFGKQCGFFAVLPSTNQLRDKAKRLACLLAVPTLPKQPVLPLVERLVTDLQLPSGLVSVVLKLMDQHYDLENLPPREDLASYSSGCAEVQAISWVLVAMKVVLGMDGSTETLLSDLARQVNLALGGSAWPCAQPNVKPKKILFDFYAWMHFIELRTHKLIGQGVTMHSMPLSYTLHCSSFEGFCRKNCSITSRPVPVLSDKDKRKRGRPFKKFLTQFGCESASQASDKTPTLFSQHGLIEKFIKEATISGTGAAQLQQHFPATKLECFLEPMEMNETLQPLGIQINWTAPMARDVCIHPFWHGAREKNVYVTAHKKLRHEKRVKRIDEKLHLNQPASDIHCTHVLNCQLPLSQYWVYRASTKRASQEDWEHFTQQLPASFVWLLNTCSALVWEHPRFVYEEMSRLEVLLFQVKSHGQL